MWICGSDRQANRSDGAYVYKAFGYEKKTWIAVAPDRKTWLLKKNGKQRRWLTAENAMRALDKEFPPKQEPKQ